MLLAAALVPWLPARWLVKSLMNLRFSLSGPHSALGWTCSGWVASEVCHKCILCPGCLPKSCNTAPGSVNFMQMKHNTSSSSNPFSQFIQILHHSTLCAPRLYKLLQNGSFTTCVGNKSHFSGTDWQCSVIKSMVSNAGNYFKWQSRNASKLVSYQEAQMLLLDGMIKTLVLMC